MQIFGVELPSSQVRCAYLGMGSVHLRLDLPISGKFHFLLVQFRMIERLCFPLYNLLAKDKIEDK